MVEVFTDIFVNIFWKVLNLGFWLLFNTENNPYIFHLSCHYFQLISIECQCLSITKLQCKSLRNQPKCMYVTTKVCPVVSMMASSNGNFFPRYWPFLRGIHRSPVESPHKGQWRGILVFSLICAWKTVEQTTETPMISGAHYDVTVMDRLTGPLMGIM